MYSSKTDATAVRRSCGPNRAIGVTKRWSLAALALVVCMPLAAQPVADNVALANPLVGTARYDGGAMYPGAALPHSMVKLSPDTTKPSTAGYNPDEPILGFSHTHIGGTGGKAFGGQIRLRPQSGALNVAPAAAAKSNEAASPGYYAVDLAEDKVRAELTVTERAGFHRYTFAPNAPARVLVDISSVILNYGAKDLAGYPSATSAKFVSDREMEGSAGIIAGFEKMPFTVHFVAVFDQPVTARGAWLNGEAQPNATSIAGGEKQDAGLYVDFAPGATVNVRVGISYTSIEHARNNLQPANGLNFDQVHARAKGIWAKEFSSIAVEGGTDAQRRQFYTALYHMLLTPTDVTGDNAGWAKDDKQTVYWDIYCIWDTFRTSNPMLTLIKPELQSALIQHLLVIYQRTGWLPDAWVYSNPGIPFQGGTHADNLIADAFVKNLGGFDRELAYEAVRKNATVPTSAKSKLYTYGGRFAPYFDLGYVPSLVYIGKTPDGRENEYSAGVSRTIEYAQNDYSVSLIAEAMGKKEDAELFRKRSQSMFTLFHPEKKMFWGKTATGEWMPDADPTVTRINWKTAFYEGNGWQYRFSVPHDMQGLINRYGGNTPFLSTLDEYFDRGLHWQGNEPTFLNPWAHVYAGRPDKNVDRVRTIMEKEFRLEPKGYPGDEDVGTMSAWYLFAAMGFYPNAGQDIYLMSSPLFKKMTMKLGNSGKTFVISAPNLSDANKYVQSATLNGKPLKNAWFRHGDIAKGAKLVLKMGPKPSKWGTQTPPPSMTPRS